MLLDFVVILMTKNLINQVQFYKDVLDLELIFENADSVGLGKDERVFLILREDNTDNSHHLSEHKGPQIMTFKYQADVNSYIEKINNAGFKIRDMLKLPDRNRHFLFIEDYESNELCLEFPL